jgi:hypothetical protein
VKQPINIVTLQHNLRHVQKELSIPETKLKHHMPDSAEAFQATSNPEEREPPICDTTHENSLASAQPWVQGSALGLTERHSTEENAFRMSIIADMGPQAGDKSLQEVTNESRPHKQVKTQFARKTTRFTKRSKVGGVQRRFDAIDIHANPVLSQASVSSPPPRAHEDAEREAERSFQRQRPTRPQLPPNCHPPLVSTRLSPINGAKRKSDVEIHDMRLTKRPRVPSDHEFKLMANNWANELKACDYVGSHARQYDAQNLGRLNKVLDLIEKHKKLSTAHFGLLSVQETNVVGLLQDLTRGNGLEKRSPTRLKAKKILVYWREEFRQRKPGDLSD